MGCLGIVIVVAGLMLLATAYLNGRSLVLAVGSLAYVLVGGWVLLNYRSRRPRG